MPLMRRGGPGLVRGVARTAAVAGTATAVSGRVQHRQQERWAAQEQAKPQPAAPPQYAAPAPAPAGDPNDPVAQIERLAQLEQQGMLTPDEFAAMKAKILAG